MVCQNETHVSREPEIDSSPTAVEEKDLMEEENKAEQIFIIKEQTSQEIKSEVEHDILYCADIVLNLVSNDSIGLHYNNIDSDSKNKKFDKDNISFDEKSLIMNRDEINVINSWSDFILLQQSKDKNCMNIKSIMNQCDTIEIDYYDINYILKDEILRVVVEDEFKTNICTFLPQIFLRKAFKLCHISPTAVHFSLENTLMRFEEKFYAFEVALNFQTFYDDCKTCQANRTDNAIPAPLEEYPITDKPFEITHEDSVAVIISEDEGKRNNIKTKTNKANEIDIKNEGCMMNNSNNEKLDDILVLMERKRIYKEKLLHNIQNTTFRK